MSAEKITSAYEVTGPYKYAGDSWPCFRIDGPRSIIAIVFIVEEDEGDARARAERMAEALETADVKA